MASPRQSALAARHRALGSPLGDWNGMDVPWSYTQDVNIEHRAVRTAAGLFDVSGLRKIHVTGPDAQAVLNHVCTRDLISIYPGRSAYSLILNEEGRLTDDCIMFHIKPNDWMMVHGSGTGRDQLQKSAAGKDVAIEFDDDLHDISLQGPKSVDVLAPHTPCDLPSLKYFHHVPTTLFGHDALISRTGYSGERGYEIFAKARDIGPLWDNILKHGAAQGVVPCSFNCIDMIRVEAGLLFYPYDMDESNSPWELGLGFAVSKDKQADYRGKQAAQALIGKDRIRTYAMIADSDRAVDADAEIYHEGRRVGRVTAPMYSTLVRKSYAMVQLEPALARPDVKLEVRGKSGTCNGTTHPMPLLDPKKEKRTS
ncbi:MAG: Aminomethyltransferase [Gammaproteobacteria bacterium]|nr:Aminomethyltransferase [Gammaproteobacteria bacterium]